MVQRSAITTSENSELYPEDIKEAKFLRSLEGKVKDGEQISVPGISVIII